MLTKGYSLNKIHFKTDEQYKSSIGFSNLNKTPHINENESQSNGRLNLLFHFIHSSFIDFM